MIQMQSNLDVADNSGAKRVQCIKVLGGSKRRFAGVGDIIVVSVKEAAPRGRVKKGDVHKAVIVRTAKDIHRPDGSTIRFDSNAAVLVNNNAEPIVQSVEDTLTTFVTTGLDYLVIEDFLIRRRPGRSLALDDFVLQFRPVTRLTKNMKIAPTGHASSQ